MTPLETTHDTLYNGAVHIVQPKNGYRFGLDALMLAGCVSLSSGQAILELGCGVGVVLNALAHRGRRDGIDSRLTGIESEPEIAALAQQNAVLNQADMHIVNGNLTDKALFDDLGRFDQIVCNPPYHPTDRSTPAADAYRTTAHIETADGLSAWLHAANRFLNPKGRFTMIHRADRLHDYLPLCAKFLGNIAIIPVWPKAGLPAKRLVITGVKGSRGGMVMHPGLVVHETDGGFTAEADAVLYQAAAFLDKD